MENCLIRVLKRNGALQFLSLYSQYERFIEGSIDTTSSYCLPSKIFAAKIDMKSLKVLILGFLQTLLRMLFLTIFKYRISSFKLKFQFHSILADILSPRGLISMFVFSGQKLQKKINSLMQKMLNPVLLHWKTFFLFERSIFFGRTDFYVVKYTFTATRCIYKTVHFW